MEAQNHPSGTVIVNNTHYKNNPCMHMTLEKIVTAGVLGILLIASLSFLSWPTSNNCPNKCEKLANLATRRAVSFRVTETSVSKLAQFTRCAQHEITSSLPLADVISTADKLYFPCWRSELSKTRDRHVVVASVTPMLSLQTWGLCCQGWLCPVDACKLQVLFKHPTAHKACCQYAL